MNIHAPSKEIQEHFKCLTWVGKRFTKSGKTYIKTKHIYFGTLYYCFEDNFAWFP